MSRTYILGAARGFIAEPPRTLRKTSAAPQRLGGPLSNEQKARLCIECAKSHDQDGALDAEQYRHAEVQKAVGKPGLTACTQDDWRPLLAHFLALQGRTGEAFEHALAHGTEPARVWMFKLGDACNRAGLPMAYPDAICRRQYRCALSDASATQLRNLTFTVINRGNARRKQQ